MPNRIVHFEIPANDIDRCKKFYEDLFDWKIEKFPMDGAEYYGVMSAEKDSTEPGINGGMYKRMKAYEPETVEQITTNYVSVDDCQTHADKAVTLGARVTIEKTAVGNMGWFVIVVDTENNLLGLWEDIPKDKQV